MDNGIKNIKPTAKSGYKQGYFKPINESKYVGKMPIIYRSSWEKKFSIYCDGNPFVIKWGSEMFAVRYFNILDEKYHTYYPDFFIRVDKNGVIKNYIVEIKPKSQITKPIPPTVNSEKARKSYMYAARTYITNLCKIEALRKFAKEKNCEVIILTEKSKFII